MQPQQMFIHVSCVLMYVLSGDHIIFFDDILLSCLNWDYVASLYF